MTTSAPIQRMTVPRSVLGNLHKALKSEKDPAARARILAAIDDARQDLAAARVAAAVRRELSSARLKRAHADELIELINGGTR